MLVLPHCTLSHAPHVFTCTSRPGGHSAIEEVPRHGIPHQVRHHHIASVWHSWQHNKQIQERDNHSIEHCEVVRRPAACITPPRKCSNIRRCIAQLTLFERNTQPYLHPRPRASHRLRFARIIAQLADIRSARPRATASDVFVHRTCSHRRQVAASLPLLHSSCQLHRSNESDATEHCHLSIHAITSVPINDCGIATSSTDLLSCSARERLASTFARYSVSDKCSNCSNLGNLD